MTPISIHGLPPISKRITLLLEPYASAFEHLICAIRCRNGNISAAKEVTKLSRALNKYVAHELGHPGHPALMIYAFRLLCRFYHDASNRASGDARMRYQQIIDDAWGIIYQLEEENKVVNLGLMLS